MNNFQKNEKKILNLFKDSIDKESIYLTIIDFGKKLPKMDKKYIIDENEIKECQSKTYIYSYIENNKIFFKSYSNAYISAGLAHILIMIYQNLDPKNLENEPKFLEELKIFSSLSFLRKNGFLKMYEKMKKDAKKLASF